MRNRNKTQNSSPTLLPRLSFSSPFFPPRGKWVFPTGCGSSRVSPVWVLTMGCSQPGMPGPASQSHTCRATSAINPNVLWAPDSFRAPTWVSSVTAGGSLLHHRPSQAAGAELCCTLLWHQQHLLLLPLHWPWCLEDIFSLSSLRCSCAAFFTTP